MSHLLDAEYTLLLFMIQIDNTIQCPRSEKYSSLFQRSIRLELADIHSHFIIAFHHLIKVIALFVSPQPNLQSVDRSTDSGSQP